MKIYGLFASIVIIIVVLILSIPLLKPKNNTDEVTFKTASGNANFDVEIADSAAARSLGLMNREKMPQSAGMLFIFDSEQIVSFWMKNTLIPLDMIFIKEDGKVASIKKNVQSCKQLACESYSSELPVKYAVEINAGLSDKMGIKVGTAFDYESLNIGGVIVNNGSVVIVNKTGYGWVLPRVRVNSDIDLAANATKLLSAKYGIQDLNLVGYLGKLNRYSIGKNGTEDKTEMRIIDFFLFKTKEKEFNIDDSRNSGPVWVKKEDVLSLLTSAKSREFYKSIMDKI